MKQIKKTIAFILSIILIVCVFPTNVFSATGHSHFKTTQTTKDGALQYTTCNYKYERNLSYSVDKYPETSHSYSNNANEKYAYSCPNVDSLQVAFSNKTYTEPNYDFITVSYSGKVIGKYSGSQLAGKTLTIPSNSFEISFTSDGSKTFYGFSIDTITATKDDFSYILSSIANKESPHNYANDKVYTYNYSCPGANACFVTFDNNTYTESKADYITITDGKNATVGRYSGSQLQGKTIKIPTSDFTITLSTDQSKVYYGFKITKLTAITSSITRYVENPVEGYDYVTPKVDYPESPHNYANNAVYNYTYSYPYAKALTITFSDKCYSEANYDVISIYSEQGTLITQLSGSNIANAVVTVPSGAFRIKFTTDRSKNFYGFSIDSIVATLTPNNKVGLKNDSLTKGNAVLPVSDHNYKDNQKNNFFTYTDPLATSIDILFNPACQTEKNYDFIIVRDANGRQIAKYSGTEAASKSVHIDTNSFTIELNTDTSKNYYGYSLYYISPNYTTSNNIYKALTEGSVYNYPESNHNYENYALNTLQEYNYTCPYENADGLEVRFSDKCLLEKNADYIYIYDGNNKLIGSYTYDQLANRTVYIPTNKFTVKLKSDRSVNFYGFSIDSILAVYHTDYYVENELNHNIVTTAYAPSTYDNSGYELCHCIYCNAQEKHDYGKLVDASDITVDYIDTYAYTNSVITPNVSATYADKKLTLNKNYTISYNTDSKSVGTHTATLKFKSPYVGSKTITYKIVPTSVTSLTLTPAYKQIAVNWQSSASNISGYEIEYADNEVFNNSKVITTSSTAKTTTLTNLSNWTKYYVRVRTYSTVNNVKYYSEYSQIQSARTFENAQGTPPATQIYENQTDYDLGSNQLSVAWKDIEDVQSYTVQVAINSTFTNLIGQYSVTDNFIVINNVPKYPTYYVRVRSEYASKSSAWGTYTLDLAEKYTPVAPSSLTLTSSPNSITAKWSESDKATDYIVELSKNSSFTNPVSIETLSTEYTFAGLEYETTYYVRVKALHYDYESAYKSSSIKTKEFVINEGIVKTPVVQKDGGVSFYTFNKPAFASQYHIPKYYNTTRFSESSREEAYQEYLRMFKKAYAEIGITPDMDDMTKFVRISEWIYLNVEYTDDDRTNIDVTAYHALKTGKTVCMGFAALMVDFCYFAGVPAYYVTTDNSYGAWSHAYIFVQLDGYWYICDPQMNRPFGLMLNCSNPYDEIFDKNLAANPNPAGFYIMNGQSSYWKALCQGYKDFAFESCQPFGTSGENGTTNSPEFEAKLKNAFIYCADYNITGRVADSVKNAQHEGYPVTKVSGYF